MSLKSPTRRYDAVVLGGGFYGTRIAIFLREQLGLRSVLILEREAELMQRASYVNQARVHNGYHYPRSILTAYRSRVNFPVFSEEYRDAVVDGFDHLYAIARERSKVSARQFEQFCSRIGAELTVAAPELRKLFDRRRIEQVYKVTEPAFDSRVLREMLVDRINRVGGIEIATSTEVHRVAANHDGVLVETSVGAVFGTRVISALYSGVNSLHRASGIDEIAVQHELTEMALVRLPTVLEGIGITVMDGPYFSIMPFPDRGTHTLSHVRYTPHHRWRDTLGGPAEDPYALLDAIDERSNFVSMRTDAMRYVPTLGGMEHVESIREVKTVLTKSDSDDSRPILYRPDHGIPGYTCILGAKLDNIYDVFQELMLHHA